MKTLFFLFTIVWIVWELSHFFNGKRYLQIKTVLLGKAKQKRQLPRNVAMGCTFVFYWLTGMIYMFWSFAGLMTSQWLWFIPLILAGFIPKKTQTAVEIDGLLTAIYLTLLLIDTYHNII